MCGTRTWDLNNGSSSGKCLHPQCELRPANADGQYAPSSDNLPLSMLAAHGQGWEKRCVPSDIQSIHSSVIEESNPSPKEQSVFSMLFDFRGKSRSPNWFDIRILTSISIHLGLISKFRLPSEDSSTSPRKYLASSQLVRDPSSGTFGVHAVPNDALTPRPRSFNAA